MCRRLALLALAVVLAAPILRAQTPDTPKVPACPSTATLDDLIKAVDAAVSGPANKDRTCFRDLFTPDARLAPVAKQPDGNYAPHLLTVDDWINRVAQRGSSSFFERQVKVKSEVYGHIAHLWSTYETRATPDGKAEVRGINSIQAINDGTRWRIIEIIWQAETPAEQVPQQYLP
jgi:hypothetical protein